MRLVPGRSHKDRAGKVNHYLQVPPKQLVMVGSHCFMWMLRCRGSAAECDVQHMRHGYGGLIVPMPLSVQRARGF